jgi:hypothetical protein
VDGGSCRSYRELNAAANVLARTLMNAGFRRGACAHVTMSPAGDLAVVLLAVLKAGGCYTWSDPGTGGRATLRFDDPCGRARELEIGQMPPATVCGASNLPVITRETDAACVMPGEGDRAAITVPHATIVAMTGCAAAERLPFAGESGAFDLWVPLLNGTTAVVEERPAAAA